MKKALITSLILLTTATLSGTPTGEQLVDKHCASCHLFTSNSGHLTNGKMGGPPMWGIMKKVRAAYKTQAEQRQFIYEYALSPSEEKMLFPKATKEYFGLMPSVKKSISSDEMKSISKFLVNYQAVQ